MPSFPLPEDAHLRPVQRQQLCVVFWRRETMNLQATLRSVAMANHIFDLDEHEFWFNHLFNAACDAPRIFRIACFKR